MADQWLGLCAFTAQALVRELRSHMPYGAAKKKKKRKKKRGPSPVAPVVKNPPANSGDTGLSPGLGRSHMPRTKPVHYNY